jgi:glyoxylate reductase
MAKVFVTRPIPEVGIEKLKSAGCDVVVNKEASDRAATIDELESGVKDCDAILSVLTERISSELIESAGDNLKIIANYAVGYDNIDLDAAKEKSIVVTNTPDVLSETVAEFSFALLMSLARRIPEADLFTKAGKYNAWGPQLLMGGDLHGKTLGIVGLGRIGSLMGHYASEGFSMKVLYSDMKRNEQFEKDCNGEFCETLDDLLQKSDFVTLHVPLLPSTKHLINSEKLSMMKADACLINTSRGPVVEEEALIEALENKTIRGAALDVFEFEPEVSDKLKEMSNVILTPHIASASMETRYKMAELAADNIIAVLGGNDALNPVS